MKKLLLAAVAAAGITVGLAAPATAMHGSPAPVEEPAPEWSGHYSTPDTGEKGEARPWTAGPAWNR